MPAEADESPHVEIRLGDCLQVMASIPDQTVDVVATDPPYCAGAISESQRTRAAGQGLRSENIRRFGWFVGDNMGTAGLVWLLRMVAIESRRILKPTGHLLVFCDWRMLSSLQPAIESASLRYQDLIVWDKGSFGLGTGFRKQHELVMHFTNGSPEYHDKATGNVIRCPRVAIDDREHQTQKPVPLLESLIRVVCPEGGTVVDPFCGSGATAEACVRLDRHFIGCDHDPENVAVAEKRVQEQRRKSARPLFVSAVPVQSSLFAEDEAEARHAG